MLTLAIYVHETMKGRLITTVTGLTDRYARKKILNALMEWKRCDGCLAQHPEYGKVLMLSGDRSTACQQFFMAEGLADKSSITITREDD